MLTLLFFTAHKVNNYPQFLQNHWEQVIFSFIFLFVEISCHDIFLLVKGKTSISNSINREEGKEKIYGKEKNDSQSQSKGMIDIMEHLFFLFCKIRKILTRGVQPVVGKREKICIDI